MTVIADPSGLKDTKWHEYMVRFLAGGVITVIAGLIARKWGPGVGGLFLAFPGAAIERPLALRGSWDRVTGDYWRFLACVLLCYLPLAIVAELIGRASAATAFGAVWIALEVVRLAVTFDDIAVLYALLAEVYRGIAGPDTPGAAADVSGGADDIAGHGNAVEHARCDQPGEDAADHTAE